MHDLYQRSYALRTGFLPLEVPRAWSLFIVESRLALADFVSFNDIRTVGLTFS